ncbi:unnamed protein product [Gongylonema pulchrum]|uniref:SGNH domain-containing protein n=1 Tax=Gongylonema pulchrum TaxID=637853 RepID=A0A183E0R6_9BILA|nr:unnamed protein product [Gongylonema pulchrum]
MEERERVHLLNEMLEVLSAQYCSEVVSRGVLGGASIIYNTMVANAHRLRDSIVLSSPDQREHAKWAHLVLLERIPMPLLATYINLLRFCKINALIYDFTKTKICDPQSAAILKTINRRYARDVCFIMVSPNMSIGKYHLRNRSHEYMFRTLLPSVAERTVYVKLNFTNFRSLSLCDSVNRSIRLISHKVLEVHRKYPDLKIVLVGWGTSCVLNHQVSCDAC